MEGCCHTLCVGGGLPEVELVAAVGGRAGF